MALTTETTRETLGDKRVVVVRSWAGGPRKGTIIRPTAGRRAHLLRLGMVALVPVESDDEEPLPVPKRKRKPVRAR